MADTTLESIGTGAATGALAGATLGWPGAVVGGLVGGISGWLSASSSSDADKAAAAYQQQLQNEHQQAQALWTSTINNLNTQLPALQSEYSTFQNQMIQLGQTNSDEVNASLKAFQQQYTPLYSSLVTSAQNATAQLDQLAGSSLGTSQSYLQQLRVGTQALNARLSSQSLLGSSAGNSQFGQFAQNLGAQDEQNRQNLLTGISNTGVQAAGELQQAGQFTVGLQNQVAQQNINNQTQLGETGANLAYQGLGMQTNANQAYAGQLLWQQGITAQNMQYQNALANQQAQAPFNFLGQAAGATVQYGLAQKKQT